MAADCDSCKQGKIKLIIYPQKVCFFSRILKKKHVCYLYVYYENSGSKHTSDSSGKSNKF